MEDHRRGFFVDRIGFVGLGAMGMPMAANLVTKGFSVSGFDVRAESVSAFEGKGGTGAASAADAARGADAIVLMVVNAAQAEYWNLTVGPTWVRFQALLDRQLAALGADVIATGNVGCATQIARYAGTPVVHTVELLDWATGGPRPAALAARPSLPQENHP